MDNNFHNDIEKTSAVPVVQCKGLSYTLQFSSQPPTIFSTVLYMENNVYNDFLRKIFVKIVVVCKGLYGETFTISVN